MSETRDKGREQRICWACNRSVAVASKLQNRGGGKARVRHKCRHGRWCIAGSPLVKAGGWNYAKCSACRREAIARERARKVAYDLGGSTDVENQDL